ncbi:hypothetical protein NLJ89_g12431 [Agrocybe chaxingu]|uniref:LIM zinc-binding domain-containing protein n=1 Tax=Agrocybe chaxingu TaxID=84603 RepID=A0A9W8MQ80_9AGAR|nr:hypothetical protein NLJ89_g12431 [Agrocybe chaxingu]
MDTVSSKASSSRQRRDYEHEEDEDGFLHRSNTVQGVVNSPDVKPIKLPKLPTRSLTSPQLERDKALGADGARVKKERVKKVKVCLKCQKTIDNGRWVSVDNGGVLCEKCWKNMYLPKCRRCTLPIEKAAVSSSDGQLKGKYHRDCFNCHICHVRSSSSICLFSTE